MTTHVLILCTHNSARSVLAEGMLNHLARQAGRDIRAHSAGSAPSGRINPLALEALRKAGVDVAGVRSKRWDEFTGPDAPRMDFVITLCDVLQGQHCPDFGDKPVTGAWPLPDPAKFAGSAVEHAIMINELYGMIRRRLDIFVNLPYASLDRMALKKRLDEIGDSARQPA